MTIGEQLNVSLLIEGRLTSDGRAQVIRRLLDIGKPWAGDPHEVRLNYLESAEIDLVSWTGSLKDLPNLLAADVLMHIYLKGEDGRTGVLTVEQGLAVANLVLSLPLFTFRDASIRTVESVVLSVARTQALGASITIAGAEFEADAEARSVEEALRRAVADTSLIAFIAGPPPLLHHAPPGFQAVDCGSTRLLRHQHAELRLRGAGRPGAA